MVVANLSPNKDSGATCATATSESMLGAVSRRAVRKAEALFALTCLVLLAALLAGCGGSATGQTSVSTAHAPDFQITAYQGFEVLGGETIWLSSLFSREPGAKKPMVLNFWAGQCPPCRAEMPDLQQVYTEHADRILLFGVDVGPFVGLGSREEGEMLLRELGVTYPAGTTLDEGVIRQYGLVAMPTTYFIKPDGAIHETWSGLLTEDKVMDLVEDLLEAS